MKNNFNNMLVKEYYSQISESKLYQLTLIVIDDKVKFKSSRVPKDDALPNKLPRCQYYAFWLSIRNLHMTELSVQDIGYIQDILRYNNQ